jgi:hypothetical protein
VDMESEEVAIHSLKECRSEKAAPQEFGWLCWERERESVKKNILDDWDNLN